MRIGVISRHRSGIAVRRVHRRIRRSSRFAEDIAARYEPVRAALPRVPQVLMRHRLLSLSRQWLTIGIALTTHAHPVTITTAAGRREPRGDVRTTVLERRSDPPASAARPSLLAPQLDRILAREQRLERIAHERSVTAIHQRRAEAARQPRRPHAADQRLELVLKRTLAVGRPATPDATKSAKPAAAVHEVKTGARATARHDASGAATIPLSPRELGQLTDEVIQALDRRIVAERERRGVI